MHSEMSATMARSDGVSRSTPVKCALAVVGCLAMVAAYSGTTQMMGDGGRDVSGDRSLASPPNLEGWNVHEYSDEIPFEIIPIERPNQRSRRLAAPVEEKCTLRDTDLFLPMQKKDLPLSHTLWRSIELKLPCFKDLVIIVPPDCREEITAVAPDYAKLYVVPEPLPEQFGYLSQQVIKLYSDTFTTGEYVLILEADQIFTGWNDGCFFADDGRLKMRCITYADDPLIVPYWKKGTQHALWRTVEDDCVVSTPFIYPRDVFSSLRDWVQHIHNKPFGEFMEDYYPGHSIGWSPDSLLFSEFNILNHYLLFFMPERVKRVTQESDVKDFWSAQECSQHIGGLVPRNPKLDNPKLTSEYFQIAYDYLKEPAEHPVVEIDLSEIPGQEKDQGEGERSAETTASKNIAAEERKTKQQPVAGDDTWY